MLYVYLVLCVVGVAVKGYFHSWHTSLLLMSTCLPFLQTVICKLCFYFQSFQLQLQPPSGNSLPPLNSGTVTQVIRLNNPQKVSEHM